MSERGGLLDELTSERELKSTTWMENQADLIGGQPLVNLKYLLAILAIRWANKPASSPLFPLIRELPVRNYLNRACPLAREQWNVCNFPQSPPSIVRSSPTARVSLSNDNSESNCSSYQTKVNFIHLSSFFLLLDFERELSDQSNLDFLFTPNIVVYGVCNNKYISRFQNRSNAQRRRRRLCPRRSMSTREVFQVVVIWYIYVIGRPN